MLVKLLQPLNMENEISVTFFGITIFLKLLQPSKVPIELYTQSTPSGKLVTVSGRTTLSKLRQ